MSETYTITSFSPLPYYVLAPIQAQVVDNEPDYLAVYADICASGDTVEEALTNLKDKMVAHFELLSRHTYDSLSKTLCRQKTLLTATIGRML